MIHSTLALLFVKLAYIVCIFLFVYDNTIVYHCFWGYNLFPYRWDVNIDVAHPLAFFLLSVFFSIQRICKFQVGNLLQMARKRCPEEIAQLHGSWLFDPWADKDVWWFLWCCRWRCVILSFSWRTRKPAECLNFHVLFFSGGMESPIN